MSGAEAFDDDRLGEQAVAELLAGLGVLANGHFRLSSGLHSDTYLQCQLALGQPTVALRLGRALAAEVADRGLHDVDAVASPALGGLLAGFAVAAALPRPFVFTERDAEGVMRLRRGQRLQPGWRVLVVEDVVTTGGSAAEAAEVVRSAGAEVVGLACLVDRAEGRRTPLGEPAALLRVEAAAWTPEQCPRCAAGEPVTAPGSRPAG